MHQSIVTYLMCLTGDFFCIAPHPLYMGHYSGVTQGMDRTCVQFLKIVDVPQGLGDFSRECEA